MSKIYNHDGLVDHRPTRRKPQPEKTPVQLLEDAIADPARRAVVAQALGLVRDASVGYVMAEAIRRDVVAEATTHAKAPEWDGTKLDGEPLQARDYHQPPVVAWPAFLATCAAFAFWAAGQVPHVPTEPQARVFRHLAHQAVAAGPGEASPINLKPTEAELRHRDAVRRWWE